MGSYIETPVSTGKAAYLMAHGAEKISQPLAFSEVPEGKALVIVVENGPFDAAGYAFDKSEF